MAILRRRVVAGRLPHPIALLVVQLLFGLFPVAAKTVFAAGNLSPLPLLGIRLAGAAFCLMALHIAFVRNPIPIRTEWPRVAGLSLLGVVLNMGLFIIGISLTTAVNAVVVITTIPVFTYALAVIMGREALGPRRALGIAVALLGVVLLVGFSYKASAEHALGDILVMLNALSYAGFLVMARPMLQKYDPLSLTTWMFLAGAVVFVPIGLMFGMRGELAQATSVDLAWVLYIIIGASVLTYVLNARVLRHVPSSTVAIFTYVQPIFTAIAAYFVLGEGIQLTVIPSAGLVFFGVWLVARAKPKVIEGQTVVE